MTHPAREGPGALRGPLSVAEAATLVVEGIVPLPAERLKLDDALGRVLAADVTAPLALPPWDNASMDGYAVRAADVARASPESPVVLPVLETVAAGGAPTRPLPAGAAIRVMTGAPVPAGADSVIRVEDTDRGTKQVALRSARDAGRNVRPRGEDLRAGDVAVAAGTRLAAGHLGVLASVGAAVVSVYGTPRVGVLASGDELVDVHEFARVGETVTGGVTKIVSSNSHALRAAVTLAGGRPVDLGLVADDRAALRARVDAARDCDLLLTSGGVSVGEFDHTREVLVALGGEVVFWRVRMRPGGPLLFGRLHGLPWLGLPGNPVSALVTFELFARPLIRRLRGESRPFRAPVPVRLEEDVHVAAPLTHFLRGTITGGPDADGALRVRLTGPQGSNLLTSMARAECLVVVPAGREVVRGGERLSALLLADETFHGPTAFGG